MSSGGNLKVIGYYTTNTCVLGTPNTFAPSIINYVVEDEKGSIQIISPPLNPLEIKLVESIHNRKKVSENVQLKAQNDQGDFIKVQQMANRLEQQGEYIESIKVYQQFINKHPKSIFVEDALYRQAFCYNHYLKEYGKALEIYYRIIDTYPNSSKAGYSFFDIYTLCKETQKYSELVKVLERMVTHSYPAISLHAEREQFLFEIGFIYEHHLHNSEKALHMFKQVIGESPSSIWAVASEAEIRLSSGDIENAIEKYRSILERGYSSFIRSGIDLPERITSYILNFFKSKGIKIRFSANKELSIEAQKQIIACVFLILPPTFLEKLEKLDFESYIPKVLEAGGAYDILGNSISISEGEIGIKSIAVEIIIHELMHHWDLSIDKEVLGRSGIKVPAEDPSSIYYNISWSFYKIHPWLSRLREKDPRDFMDTGTSEDKRKKHGMRNPREDFATFGTTYVCEFNIRGYIREQMALGNFEPAAKYLYIRFHTPFRGKEYHVSKDKSSLGFEEVKSKLSLWLERHPNSVAQSTIEVINKIEDIYKVYSVKGIR